MIQCKILNNFRFLRFFIWIEVVFPSQHIVPIIWYLLYSSLVMDRKSKPNITYFELLQIWQVELRTHSNPCLCTKTELQTHSNPFKNPDLQTCLARNRTNFGTILEKPNFSPFWTKVHLQKLNYEPNPPDPSKNLELRIHELGSTQHYWCEHYSFSMQRQTL